MLNLYKCEYCGKVYDDYTEAQRCEDAHLKVDWWATQDRAALTQYEYTTRGKMPTQLEIASEIEYGDFNEATQKYNRCRYIGTYKLVETVCEKLVD